MPPTGDMTLPATRRTRRSIGGQSPAKKTSDKENATIDVGGTLAANRRKSRSKSMGPGGLDGLKPSAGNRRVVSAFYQATPSARPLTNGLLVSSCAFKTTTKIDSQAVHATPSRDPATQSEDHRC